MRAGGSAELSLLVTTQNTRMRNVLEVAFLTESLCKMVTEPGEKEVVWTRNHPFGHGCYSWPCHLA